MKFGGIYYGFILIFNRNTCSQCKVRNWKFDVTPFWSAPLERKYFTIHISYEIFLMKVFNHEKAKRICKQQIQHICGKIQFQVFSGNCNFFGYMLSCAISNGNPLVAFGMNHHVIPIWNLRSTNYPSKNPISNRFISMHLTRYFCVCIF